MLCSITIINQSKTMKTMYDLKLHESIETTIQVGMEDGRSYSVTYQITRVPGGWIYKGDRITDQPIFISFNNEFQTTNREDKRN